MAFDRLKSRGGDAVLQSYRLCTFLYVYVIPPLSLRYTLLGLFKFTNLCT